jgi:hypothetical protein
MMALSTQDHWLSGLCPLSGIPEAIKHDVSETGSASVLRLGRARVLLGCAVIEVSSL